MKRFTVAAVLPFLTIGAAAQNGSANKVFANVTTNVMGEVVKGAPYSADEVSESSQVLADGTHISNQNKTKVFRDSEGRVRRETGNAITIWDPVANVSYELNPKTMAAVKVGMFRVVSDGGSQNGVQATGRFYFSGSASSLAETKEVSAAKAQDVAAMLDKLTAEAAVKGMVVNGNSASPQTEAAAKGQLQVAMKKMLEVSGERLPGASRSEALGQKVMQGVTAEGTRSTSTLETGAIGNDRPINVVSERWYSNELQTVIMTQHTDPRTGEESFHLENVSRGEPSGDLFTVPPGYQVNAGGGRIITTTRKEE